MKTTKSSSKCLVPLALSWSHSGIPYHLTPWPEVRCERLYGDDWIPVDPSEAALASAAQTIGPREWHAYLEFVPSGPRAFLDSFTLCRVPALLVAARCPALVEELASMPALTSFLAAHRELRGTREARWTEINVLYEREGIFGILRWLGLPDSRQTLAVLRHIVTPDVSRKLLEPLRSALWEPETLAQLSHAPVLDDAALGATCHALAA